MSDRTLFLARWIGLYCLVIAAAMLLQGPVFIATARALAADPPLVMVAGVFTLFLGLAMVLLHNIWRGGPLPVVITLVSWATLLKGVALTVVPPATVATLYAGASRYQLFSTALTVVLGAYLTFAGFRGRIDG